MRILLRFFTILCFLGVAFFVFAFIATRSYISFAGLCLILGIASEIVRDRIIFAIRNKTLREKIASRNSILSERTFT
jgi:hypothetical protein